MSSLQSKRQSLLSRVQALAVNDDESFARAGVLIEELRAQQRAVAAVFEPDRAAVWEAYKAVQMAIRAEMAPLEQAEEAVRKQRQDHKRREETRRSAQPLRPASREIRVTFPLPLDPRPKG